MRRRAGSRIAGRGPPAGKHCRGPPGQRRRRHPAATGHRARHRVRRCAADRPGQRVVLVQAVAGNRVYAGGSFTSARPAGAAPGTHLTRPTNLLAYDIRTGALVASFAHTSQRPGAETWPPRPTASGCTSRVTSRGRRRHPPVASPHRHGHRQARRPVRAPSGRPGQDRGRGPPRPSTSEASSVRGERAPAPAWPPSPRPTDACSLEPRADNSVNALVLTPGNGALVGGRFTTLARPPRRTGLGPVNAVTGTWAAVRGERRRPRRRQRTRLSPASADVRQARLRPGYVFGRGGNLRGRSPPNPSPARLVWIEDCHGDTYRAPRWAPCSTSSVIRTTAGTVGGWPGQRPPRLPPRRWRSPPPPGRTSWGTTPSAATPTSAGGPPPQLLDWFPDLSARAPSRSSSRPPGASPRPAPTWCWAVSSQRVNGHAQQGLVRFAVQPAAPNKEAPSGPAAALALSGTSGAGPRSLHWTTTYDRDNQLLTYTLTRAGRSTLAVDRGGRHLAVDAQRCRRQPRRGCSPGRTHTGSPSATRSATS